MPSEIKFTGWQPTALTPPRIQPELEKLAPLTRSAESIVFSILSFEYWISPNGQVREWIRHNSRLAVFLAVPAFLVLPVLTFILWQLVFWLRALTSFAGYLVVFPILAFVAVLVILVTIRALTVLLRK